ncbi:CD109 antigen [Thalassophryne amazonica]|uniref:CD109 antigen n=1 Tax=Thalassophryne amazonica TaxID=390379 RepID=UPI001470D927|nr:CD109 antigen [Thalassophryne amazonica]
MDGMWTLLVSVGVLCSAELADTQKPSRVFFLISSPEVLHAGKSTLLAVTILTDTPVRLKAEVTNGKIKVEQEQDFQGGSTDLLTLPPISGGSIDQGSSFNLTVSGYQGDELIFTNTSSLIFNLRSISTFIQTDRSNYRPGDTVKLRVVCVQLDNRPYSGSVDVSVTDPSGSTVDIQPRKNSGIVLSDFHLSQTASLGQWMITATVNGFTDEKTFTVDYYEPPPFEVLVNVTPRVLVGDQVSGTVRALYINGKPLEGTLNILISLSKDGPSAPFSLSQSKEIFGSAQFFFSGDQLQVLHTSSDNSDVTVYVQVSVTDIHQSLKVNKTVEVHFLKNMFQLEFHDFPRTLKPSLYFTTTLRISRYDRKPLSPLDLKYPAEVKVTQRTSDTDAEPATVTLPVPEDGNVPIKFRLHDEVVLLFIHARYESSTETLKLHKTHSSPSGSYLQISPISNLPAQVESQLEIKVEKTFQATSFHYVVKSGGDVVDAGTKTSSSFFLHPTTSWAPMSCFTIYCVLPDGEVTSDTVHVPFHETNHVHMKWSSDKVQPGEEVTLTLTVLEPWSYVGIMVLATDTEAPEGDQDMKLLKECNVEMLTNTREYNTEQPDGLQTDGDVLMLQMFWRPWIDVTESWLWLNTNVRDKTQTDLKVTVPDGVTSLRAVALVMSDNLGLGFTPVPEKLTVSKEFSLWLDVPSHLIRGEDLVLEVKVFNHLDRDIKVMLLISQSETFEFILAEWGGLSVVNSEQLSMGRHSFASALFPIRPKALGRMEIKVDAVSATASDHLFQTVSVKPEGVEQTFSETLFLELLPGKLNNSRSISFSFPPDVVPGSQRAHVAVVGDILALSINNLDALVQMPVSCGEQNLVHFAPSVYVLQYLKLSFQDNEELSSRALGYMMEGYQRQLSYQRDDGSFSAFGASDASGSTWLTAFVLRCFLQAQSFMPVDQNVLTRAITWLLDQQGSQGEFREAGRVIHTEMQGGLDDGPVGITAYVVAALLQDKTYMNMFEDNVSKGLKYLEKKVLGGVVSNYSLCLVAYALALSSPSVNVALEQLHMRAGGKARRGLRRPSHLEKVKDMPIIQLAAVADIWLLSRSEDEPVVFLGGCNPEPGHVTTWVSFADLESHDWQRSSVQNEMASYVLLALYLHGSWVDGIELMKWLSKQRTYLGGFGTTQDTVVGLQALAQYSAFSGAKAIDLQLTVSVPSTSSVSHFLINSTTYLAYHSCEIDARKDVHMNIHWEGRGFSLFQLNTFYNLDSRVFSEPTDDEAFALNVEIMDEGDQEHMVLSVCTRLQEREEISRTGMVMLDVGLLTGFILSPGAAAPTDLIRKVEIFPEKVSLYLDSLTTSEVCIKLPVTRKYKVAHVRQAVVLLYDYYEPQRRATRTYNSAVLHKLDACFFCGEDCRLCSPGITVTFSSTSSPEISGVTYVLDCLFIVVSLFFL